MVYIILSIPLIANLLLLLLIKRNKIRIDSNILSNHFLRLIMSSIVVFLLVFFIPIVRNNVFLNRIALYIL